MTDNTSIADLARLVDVLANCSATCRSLASSRELDIARDSELPYISQLIRRVNDCAASCDIAILLIERKSHISIDFLQICEEMTMECAWECSQYGFDICKQCAEACERAAKACFPYILQEEPV